MVITTDLRLNTPKFVPLPKMMKAKRKPLEVIKAEDLGINIKDRLETVSLQEPSVRKAGVKVGSLDELIDKMKELKAI